MKKNIGVTVAAVLSVLSVQAGVYTDSIGDDKWGNAKMDITQVEITYDATHYHFVMTLVDGTAFASDTFARFAVGIDSIPGGSSTADAWNDKIIMSTGMDFWCAGWTDAGSGTGMNIYDASLGGWPEWQHGGVGSTWVAFDTPVFSNNTVSFSIPLATLGLSGGDSFDFDVYTFWDNGSAEDALGLSTTMPNNLQYDSGSNIVTYSSSTPPEPDIYVPTNGYVAWAVSNKLTTGRYDDQDGDGLLNLGEYGMGGNPTNPADTGFDTVGSLVGDWLYYTYPENVAASNDAEYALGLTDNLLSNNWASSGYEVLGTGVNAIAVGFNAISNRISTTTSQNRFVRLEIGSANSDEWRGGDISMIPRFEELGGHYINGGHTNDPVNILMDFGMNTFRVRLFVDPDGSDTAVIQDLAYVTALGQRIKNAGAKFLLDIHYSDTWADPGQQDKPAAWTNLSFNALEAQVETYSSNVIATLKQAGCLPDMVQVGNEISAGFLWPDGGPYQTGGSWANFTTLLKAGIRGVKQPLDSGDDMRVMIHYASAGDLSGVRNFYNNLATYSVEFDVIGLSYYPWWHGNLAGVESTLDDTALRFGKEIVIVETAFPWKNNYSAMEWPQTPEGQQQFIADLMDAVRATPNGLGKGVVWWYPEAVATGIPIHVWEGGANALFDSLWNSVPALENF